MTNIFNSTKEFDLLKLDLKRESLSHAYLFLSQDEINNLFFVKELSSLFLCEDKSNCGVCPSCLKVSANTHPDVLQYPKNKNFLVDDANEIVSMALEKPMLANKKIIIINNIDSATIQAQNKILKLLEEPPKFVVFLLTATNENKILPTIISRTRKIHLSPLKKETIRDYVLRTYKVDTRSLNDSLEYGNGWIGKTLNAINNKFFIEEQAFAKKIATEFNSSKNLSVYSSEMLKYKDDIKTVLELISKEFEKSLPYYSESQQGLIKIIDEINLANQNLDKNVSINLIIDNLLMQILEIKYLYQIK